MTAPRRNPQHGPPAPRRWRTVSEQNRADAAHWLDVARAALARVRRYLGPLPSVVDHTVFEAQKLIAHAIRENDAPQ